MAPPSTFSAIQKQISIAIALAEVNTAPEPALTPQTSHPKRKRVPTQKGAVYAQEIAAEKENIQHKAKRVSKAIRRVESENEDETEDLGNPRRDVEATQPITLDLNEIRRNSAFVTIPIPTPSRLQPSNPSATSMTSSITSPSIQTFETRRFGTQHDTNMPVGPFQLASNPTTIVAQPHSQHASSRPQPVTSNQNLPRHAHTGEPIPPTPIETPSRPIQPTYSPPTDNSILPVRDETSSPEYHLVYSPNNDMMRRIPNKRPRSPSITSTHTRSSSPHPNTSSCSSSKRSRRRRNRPKLQDLEPGPKAAVLMAIQDYRSRLATHNPFPTPSEESHMAGGALLRACVSCLITMEERDLFDTAVALITARDSQMRGELKSKLAPLVQSTYGFRSLGTQSAINHNRELYDLLKSGNRLAFKDFNKRKGLYENPIIQQAINTMWFRNSSDEGIKYAEYFNPIPIQTIALVLTTVEHIVDRWASGTFKGQVAFSEKEYADVYERHLSALEGLQTYSHAAAKKLKRMRKRLYSRARRHAGMTKDENVVPLLDDEDLELFAGDPESEVSEDDAEIEESENESGEVE